MSLDVSHVLNADTWGYVGSIATHGPEVATRTFNRASTDADELLASVDPDDARAFLRAYVSEWGDLSDTEARAVLLQFIIADARECGLEDDPEGFDWDEYAEGCEAGTYSGSFYRADDGRIYFDMSH